MRVRVHDISFSTLEMKTRFPFQYGIASMTALPHLTVRAVVEIDGHTVTGQAAEGLPPKWFTKDPATSFEEDDLPQMMEVISQAAVYAQTEDETESFFDWWLALHEAQTESARDCGWPPLLAGLGVSLMERAVLDALCRHAAEPLHSLIHRNALGLRLARLHPELKGVTPRDFLPARPSEKITIRHTVGLADPLDDSDVSPRAALHDGLPHTLEQAIRAHRLTHFKIKLSGRPDQDSERLRRLARLLEREARGDWRFTLDGNEQFRDLPAFRTQWEIHRADPALASLFLRLLCVEQPLHRDTALHDSVRPALLDWPDAPPLIIDESDGSLDSLPRALALGYRGASHKNCKGITKGLANAALLWKHGGLLTGEDLACTGLALLQDLAVAALLGLTHVERNGHHYFRGLSQFPRETQHALLAAHPTLFDEHPALFTHTTQPPFTTLHIRNGALDLTSINAAPFGTPVLFH